MKNKILQLAYELCLIPSPSYEELPVLEFLELWLLRAGLQVERLALPGQPYRYNLFAYGQKKPQFTAIFCTHLDTVKPHIGPHIKDDILWGRGSCDAKGIAAAMIMAVQEELREGQHDLALLLSVGEEDASDGARAANLLLKNRASYVIIGEPTELKAAYAQKGSLVFDLSSSGIEAHSALPELGDSATHKLVATMNTLLSYPWPQHQIYGSTLLNLGTMAGGHARNMLANHASAQAIMRTAVPPGELMAIIESALLAGVSLDIKSSCEPFEYFVPPGFESMLAGFGSDAPYLREVGQPIMVGPGSLSLAHKENEHVSAQELFDGFRAYRGIAGFLRGMRNPPRASRGPL